MGQNNRQHIDERSPTQNIYGSDHLALALSNISTDLKILSRDFTSLNQQVIALGLMRRDVDGILKAMEKLTETEPELRNEFDAKVAELRGSTTFHISSIWIVVAVLMVAVALLWMR